MHSYFDFFSKKMLFIIYFLGVFFLEKKCFSKSLLNVYEDTLNNSKAIAIQIEEIYQAEQGKDQAMGAILPDISLAATASHINNSSNKLPTYESNAKIILHQPLFRGFREYATLRQKDLITTGKILDLQDAARKLYYDVATTFYTVLNLAKSKINYNKELDLTQKRLLELERFFAIGRCQRTDILTLKASIASLHSAIASVDGQLEVAKNNLRFFTGSDDDALDDINYDPLSLLDISSYLQKLEERADVKGAINMTKAKQELLNITRGAYFPTVDLFSNYYLKQKNSDANWDIGISLTLPIYQGGIISSQVRETQSIFNQFALNTQQIKKVAEKEIRNFYSLAQADQVQVEKLKELVALTKENWETETKYYRDGLVTNLEVLQALTNYQDAIRQLDYQYYILNSDYAKLMAASGEVVQIFVNPTQYAYLSIPSHN